VLAEVYASDSAKQDELAASVSALYETTTASLERKPSVIIDVWSASAS